VPAVGLPPWVEGGGLETERDQVLFQTHVKDAWCFSKAIKGAKQANVDWVSCVSDRAMHVKIVYIRRHGFFKEGGSYIHLGHFQVETPPPLLKKRPSTQICTKMKKHAISQKIATTKPSRNINSNRYLGS